VINEEPTGKAFVILDLFDVAREIEAAKRKKSPRRQMNEDSNQKCPGHLANGAALDDFAAIAFAI
jgi:hypothetical protein